MLLTNNNRSKAYLQNLINNNFMPSKIIFMNNNHTTLVEHTENDKLISKYTNQIFIRKLDDLDISFELLADLFNELDFELDNSILLSLRNTIFQFLETNVRDNMSIDVTKSINESEEVDSSRLLSQPSDKYWEDYH